MTERELALAAGVDERTLRRYRERGCTATTVDGINEWRRLNIDQRKAPADDSADIDEARLRKTNAEAALLELKFQQENGELIEAEGAKRIWSQRCAKARARLELIPHEVASEVPAEFRTDVYTRAMAAVRAALLDLIGDNDD